MAVCCLSALVSARLHSTSAVDELLLSYSNGFSCYSLMQIVRLAHRGRLPLWGLALAIPAGFVLGSKLASLAGAPNVAALMLVAAFEASAVDYLVKPVSNARLAQCVLKLQQSPVPRANLPELLKALQPPQAKYLSWVHTSDCNTTRVLSITEVLYFQASDKYTEVVTQDGKHVIRMSLKDLLRRLSPEEFAQTHRSTIVNLRFVDRLERDVLGRTLIHLRNHPETLPVGRAYVSKFRQM